MRCARSLQEIHERRVQVRKLLTKGNGRAGVAGFKPSVVQDLVAGPKKEWLDRTEAFATEVYPRWREHVRATGKRLPDEMRAKVKSHLVSDAEKLKFGQIQERPAIKRCFLTTAKRIDFLIFCRYDEGLDLSEFVIGELRLSLGGKLADGVNSTFGRQIHRVVAERAASEAARRYSRDVARARRSDWHRGLEPGPAFRANDPKAHRYVCAGTV